MEPARVPWIAVVAAGLALPSPASPQDIHKCVDKGRVGYQSTPCAHGDRVLPVKATAPSASDAAAAASRAQADKDAIAAAPPPPAPPPGVDAGSGESCRSLRTQLGEARENQRLLDREPLRPTPAGSPPSAMNNARGQASDQIRDLEARLRASNCGAARP